MKLKPSHLRHDGAHRTRKSKPYDGPKGDKSCLLIGEGIPPRHEERAIVATGYAPRVYATPSLPITVTPPKSRTRSGFWASAAPWRVARTKKES